MKRSGFQRWWLVLLVPVILGLVRLRFDAEVLDLLPKGARVVEGVKRYQEHFAGARELILAVRAPNRELAATTAQCIAERLRQETNLVSEVTWQPPWLEHPEQTAELIAYLWFNQPPETFARLARELAETNLAAVLATTREQLATTMSPAEIARLSYDPFGLTRLPTDVMGTAPGFESGEELFASRDGLFRVLFVKARGDLAGYRECMEWFNEVKRQVALALPKSDEGSGVSIGYTGRPAFVAEVAGSMKHDITLSVIGTSVIIAVLFWLAHRRWKPMLWLLILLAVVLSGTLALGGLWFGTINVVSMGFAAILLGLAVDYALVHYQEALAHPELSVPEIRRAIAPSILWAATTTIAAFLVLNLGGFPGLAQLGSLVSIGVALSAFVMIFAFLPPLFPERMKPIPNRPVMEAEPRALAPVTPFQRKISSLATVGLMACCVAPLLRGLPKMDASADALQPRGSQAFATLTAIQQHLSRRHDPLWLVVSGQTESEVARKLDEVESALNRAISNRVLSGFTTPRALWPRPEFQAGNRATARWFAGQRDALLAAALTGGFSPDALGLTGSLLDTWRRAAASTNVFWPTNPLCTWILEKLVAREPHRFYAAGFLFPWSNSMDRGTFARLEAQLSRDGVWLAGWDPLGAAVFGVVKKNLWKLLLPMASLVLMALWFAFRQFAEIALSAGVLGLSGLCLLAVMNLMGWSWNVLNLMALPLILGTGVDYSIFMQLALRRHQGDLRQAHRSVGRALLLCGGTAVSGFGSLGLSSNAGMASLGRVCGVGIGANMLLSVFLLPLWWKRLAEREANTCVARPAAPSSLYRATLWRAGLTVARWLPEPLSMALGRAFATLYWRFAARRREVVIQNLLPVFAGDRRAAEASTRRLFQEFALKVVDLWRFESGATLGHSQGEWNGWESFIAAHARGRGVLLVTPHLGNWEAGGAFLARHGYKLLVLTRSEPEQVLTDLRRKSRARRGIETLVVGEDPFAFVEIIKQLGEGATVALLVDRPRAPTAVPVELFGRSFQGSVAAAELARASGCAVLPVYVVRGAKGYSAHILPEVLYDRRALGGREARVGLTQQIVRAFEPVIRQHADQWYHFVPIWPPNSNQEQRS